MKHSLSFLELQTVCSDHVDNDPSQVVSVHHVRDSGVVSVVSVEVLDSQLPKHCTLCQQMGSVTYSASQMIIETSMSSQNLSGRSKVSLIHSDQILRELVPPQNDKHLRRVQFVGIDPAHYSISPKRCVTDAAWHGEFDPSSSVIVRTSLCKLICQFISLLSTMSRYPFTSYLSGFSEGVEGHSGLKSGAVLDYC